MSDLLADVREQAPETENGADPVSLSWRDQFKLRAGLVQQDVYAFESAVHELGGFSKDGTNILADHALKAAIAAGWVADPPSEVLKDAKGAARYFMEGVNVDLMHPGKVRAFGLKIVAHYSLAVAPPPN